MVFEFFVLLINLKHFMETLKFYLFYLLSRFTGYSVVIRIVAFVVTVLVLVYLISILRLFYINHKLKRKARKGENFTKKYGERIHEMLVSSDFFSVEDVMSKLELKEDNPLSNQENQFMSTLMTDLRDENKETYNASNYQSILTAISLIEFWEKKLKMDNLKKNQTALRNLGTISVDIPGSIIGQKVQVKNNELRKYARSEYIKFAAHDGYKFLDDDFDRDFNHFDGVRIHNALEYRNKQRQLPLLIRWVSTTKNVKYQCFLIKQIGLFKQVESNDQLLKLFVQTGSTPVKSQIVETLGVLQYEEAIPVFIDAYEFISLPVQFSIVDAMGNFKTQEALAFLELIYKSTYEDDLRIKIIQNIYKIDGQRSTINRLKNAASSDFEKKIFAYEDMILS